jgi:hypothetical protein
MSAYRDDLEALSARQVALASEVATKTRELSQASELLADARARAKLPVLDNIRVATPCSADWAKMSGDERVRACGDCKKNVYNLTEMTRDEAQALIIEKEGKLCVRYFQRKDGTILLKDCVIGVKRSRRRRIIAAGAAALLAGGAGILYRSMTADDQPVATQGGATIRHDDQYTTMGAVEMPPDEIKGEMHGGTDGEYIGGDIGPSHVDQVPPPPTKKPAKVHRTPASKLNPGT